MARRNLIQPVLLCFLAAASAALVLAQVAAGGVLAALAATANVSLVYVDSKLNSGPDDALKAQGTPTAPPALQALRFIGIKGVVNIKSPLRGVQGRCSLLLTSM